MLHAGLDLSRRRLDVCLVDDAGELCMPAPLIEFPADDPDRARPVLARSPRRHSLATVRGGRIRVAD